VLYLRIIDTLFDPEQPISSDQTAVESKAHPFFLLSLSAPVTIRSQTEPPYAILAQSTTKHK